MNKDLKEERDKVGFNIEELTNWFYGSAENVKEKRFLENFFYSDPDLRTDTSYMSHVEKYEEAIRKLTIVLKKLKELTSQGHYGEEIYPKILGAQFLKHLIKEGNPASVHYDMFIPALKSIGTQEQQDEWLPKALTCKSVIGTYVQTELGHGTFVRGLETTATYDPNTQEFILNSPTLTSYKWWPGNLGHSVNHGLVMAQLYTQNKCHGVHAFIVRLRDQETHKPMNGITIGEIGTKLGYNTVNNGYLGLKNVRIPRKNMLMKNAEVLENGEYVLKKNPLLTYGTMTMIRVGIIREVQVFLTKAVTIATRYSFVRRQSPIENDKAEPKIIEHVTQQYKIFPAMAKAFVLKITADVLWQMYEDIMKEIDDGNLSRLSELHGLSCCLKTLCTNDAAEGTEILRMSCGGHGFLNSAGFADCYKMITPAQTYEGENTVLLLQTGRYLMKTYGEILKGSKVTSTVAYLKVYSERNSKNREAFDSSPRGILRALQSATAGKIALVYKNLDARKKQSSIEEAFNQSGLELAKIAELHGRVFMLQTTLNELERASSKASPALAYVFRDILELYSVDLANKLLGDLLQFVNITSEATEILQGRLESALRRIRQYAIGIADAFDFSDSVLDSTLGTYGGNVYEKIFAAAQKSPLNQEDVNKSFHLYLKPFLKSNL